MNKPGTVEIVVAGVVFACVAFVVVLLLIKFLWSWTVPDLFPGAVEQGLVASRVSWMTAAKIAVVVAVVSGLLGGGRSGKP